MQWEEEMCIISGSYQSSDGKPHRTTVELWCRSRAGHSVTLLVNGLRPYVVIALPGKPRPASEADSALDHLRSMDWAVNVTPIGDKWTPDGDKPHWKVEVPQPWMITRGPNIRKTLQESWEVSSADILFERRLLLDYDLGPHISACGEVLWAGKRAPAEVRNDDTGDRTTATGLIAEAGGSGLYPTDMVVSCTLEGLAKVEPFRTPFVSFSFDLETSIQSNRILCAAAVIDRGGERSEHTFRGEEGDIMEGLTSLVRLEDPDIITGYNIDNFDLPRMEERGDVLAGRSKMEATALFGWGRVPMLQSEAKPRRLFPSRQQNRVWNIAGRIPLDAWWQARQTLKPQRESLSYVSKLLWPEDEDKHKLDIDASQMDREWAERPDEVLEYCVRDTVLPLDILGRLQSVARKEALASVSLTTVETASAGTTSQWIDSLVIRLADRSDVDIIDQVMEEHGWPDNVSVRYMFQKGDGKRSAMAEVLRASDPHSLFADFGKFTARNDPFIHFYETFLAAYNPKKRKARGVWYTPEPVVDFIVRAVDDVLKTEFGIADGLADTGKVTVDWDTDAVRLSLHDVTGLRLLEKMVPLTRLRRSTGTP